MRWFITTSALGPSWLVADSHPAVVTTRALPTCKLNRKASIAYPAEINVAAHARTSHDVDRVRGEYLEGLQASAFASGRCTLRGEDCYSHVAASGRQQPLQTKQVTILRSDC
jgi:hypothetical protein